MKLTRKYNELSLLKEDSEFVKGVLEVIVDKKKKKTEQRKEVEQKKFLEDKRLANLN